MSKTILKKVYGDKLYFFVCCKLENLTEQKNMQHKTEVLILSNADTRM